MALTGFATNKLSTSRPTLTSRAINSKRFTNIRGNYSRLSNPTIPLPYFVLSTVTPNVVEGQSLAISARGYNLPAADQNGLYYWTIESNAGDFGTTSGNFTMTWNGDAYGYSFGTFYVAPTSDAVIEGTEYFTVALRTGSTSGTIVATASLSINDPTTYFTFTSTPNPVTEGSTTTITVQGYNLAIESGTYYWTIETNAVDFGTTSGSFTLTSGAGSFTVSPTSDFVIEGNEPFTIAIRTGSTSGPIISTSSSLTIQDLLGETYFKFNTALISAEPVSANTFISTVRPVSNVITTGGNTRPSKFNPYTPGYYSSDFSSGSYLQITDNVLFDFAGDFTVEMWMKMGSFSVDGGASPAIISGTNDSGSWLILVGASAITLYYNLSQVFSSTTTIAVGEWFHFAWSRSSGTMRMFKNGTQIGSHTASTTYTCNGDLYVGVQKPGAGRTYGEVSNLRIVNGTGLYTAEFTPSTEPLTAIPNTVLLTCRSNRANVDISSYNHPVSSQGTVGIKSFTPLNPNPLYNDYGSAWFFTNGGSNNGDYIGGFISPTLGTLDHTIEFWYYNDGALQTYGNPWTYNGSATQQATNNYYLSIGAAGSGVLLGSGSASWTFNMGFTTPPINTWNHIALTRAGSTFRIFVNGIQAGTATTSQAIGAPNGQMLLGTYAIGAANGNWINGYISDFRYVIGTAVYTGNFTPPTAPLLPGGTAVTYPSTANVNSTFSAANTALLLCQGNKAVTNNAFLDKSNNAFAITRNGNSTQGTFSPHGSNWSNYFDGTGDYLSLPIGAYSDFGSGAFTIEMWIYPTLTATQQVIAFHGWSGSGALNFGWNIQINTSNQMAFYANGSLQAFTDLVATINAWNHIAFVGTGGVLSAYRNGIKSATTLTYTAIVDRSTMTTVIGGWNDNNELIAERYFYRGYVSNFRVVKGTAVYTSNFPAPNVTPLTAITNTSFLTCQSNRLIDTSTNRFTITKSGDTKVQRFSPYAPSTVYSPSTIGGSVYFDGTGDYLNTASQSSVPTISNAHTFLAGTDFTIEAWIYPTAAVAYQEVIGIYSGATTGRWIIRTNADGITLGFYQYPSISDVAMGAALKLNTWNHIALVRSGSTITGYINGIGTTVYNGSINLDGGAEALYIGQAYPGRTPWNGYQSDLRIVRGTAVYTGNFTPPTAPLTANGNPTLYTSTANVNTTFSGGNTNLLLNFAEAGIYDSTMLNNFETVGDVKIVPRTAYAGELYYSNYFDGSGDYLTISSAAIVNFSAAYTVECWFYLPGNLTYLAGGNNYVGRFIDAQGTGGFEFSLLSASSSVTTPTQISVSAYGGGGPTQQLATGLTIPTSQWHHIAVVRNGSNVQSIFLNGVRVATGTISGSWASNGTVYIAGDTGINYYGYFPGYIKDMRVSNGTAFYDPTLTTLTVPTAPLTAITGTTLLTCQNNRFKDNSTNNFTITINGETQITEFNPFRTSTGSSIYFDGTGDYLTTLGNDVFALGTGSFTVEAWIYPTAARGVTLVSSNYNYSTADGNWSLYFTVGSASTIYFNAGNSTGFANHGSSTTVTIPINAWTHIAYSRYGGNGYFYINGVQLGTAVADTSNYVGSSGLLYIGRQNDGTSQFMGYIQDFRITKGYARYSANFTPPTTAFIKQ
jgi:hypothetical protein